MAMIGSTAPGYSFVAAEESAEKRQRIDRIYRAWLAYQGELELPLIPQSVPGRTNLVIDDNVPLDLIRMEVDVSNYFMFGKPVTFEEVLPDAGDENVVDDNVETPAEQYLTQVWKQAKKMTFLTKAGLNGAIAGHVFIKIRPPALGQQYPRLVLLDSQCVDVDCDDEDVTQPLKYEIEYRTTSATGEDVVRQQNIWRTDVDSTEWFLETVEFTVNQQGIYLSTPRVVSPQATWPYPWPPIVDCQNLPLPNCYWGMSECEEDVLTLQKRIIGTVSNTYRILRLHAHPKTWTAGLTPRQVRQLQISADGLINLPPPDARIQNLEMTSDLGSSIQLYKTVLEGFHRVTHTPEVAAGRMESLGNLSGVAIQLLFGPLIRKVGFRRLSFGDMLEELCKRLLDMGESAGLDGITTPVGEGYDTNVAVLWPDLLPVDELALRQAYQIDHLLGASDETLLDKLGYDPQLEQSRTAGEKQLEQTQALEQVRALAQIQQQYPNPSQQPAQQQPAGGRP